MDFDVFAVGRAVLHFVLEDEHANGVADGRKARDKENGRGDKSKQITQHKNQHPETDQKQAQHQCPLAQSLCRLSNGVALKK